MIIDVIFCEFPVKLNGSLVPKVNIHHRANANKLASNCVICRGPLGQGGCSVQGKKLKSHLAAPTVLLLTTVKLHSLILKHFGN